MKLIGNSYPNTLQGGAAADLIYGKGGNDSLYGWGGNDTIYGDAGNDLLDGGTGNDKLYGGDGNDQIIGGSGKDYANGGFGRDVITGAGTLIGGQGDDIILIGAGSAFGDNPTVSNATGNDRLGTDFAEDAGQLRSMTGGPGANQFEGHMDARDGIATRLEVKDFTRGTGGDHIYLDQHAADGSYARGGLTFDQFDTNNDNQLDASDGAGAAGRVYNDAKGLGIQGLDGDVMVIAGHSLVYAGDFILG